MENNKKNIAKRFFDEVIIEDSFAVFTFKNETADRQIFERHVGSHFIQFHFGLKGTSTFIFNDGSYKLNLGNESSLLLYNPQRDLPLHLDVHPNSCVISVLISIKKFHALFSEEADYITFLSKENKDKKYYKDSSISPSILIVLNQIFNYNLSSSMKKLYVKGKIYELLSLFFNRNEDANIEQCPFLVDEANVQKIKKAKDIILARMAEPPTLQELADEIELSLKKLKEGFKQIYGDSVYSFLFNHKMEVARKLLESRSHNVNEVGLKVGYSTGSHFIAAFKKKYGTTPKKYLMSLS